MAVIQTRYDGCLFRSRLEARWAVFFNFYGIGWEYEPEGFTVDGVPYLPDFRLPGKVWVEVKGEEDRLNIDLVKGFVREHGGWMLVLGPIPTPDPAGEWCWPRLQPSGGGRVNVDWASFGAWLGTGGMWKHFGTGFPTEPVRWTVPLLDTRYRPTTLPGYTAARSARFEHGEQPPHRAPLRDLNVPWTEAEEEAIIEADHADGWCSRCHTGYRVRCPVEDDPDHTLDRLDVEDHYDTEHSDCGFCDFCGA